MVALPHCRRLPIRVLPNKALLFFPRAARSDVRRLFLAVHLGLLKHPPKYHLSQTDWENTQRGLERASVTSAENSGRDLKVKASQ